MKNLLISIVLVNMLILGGCSTKQITENDYIVEVIDLNSKKVKNIATEEDTREKYDVLDIKEPISIDDKNSQITIKNTSKETIYGINVSLEEKEGEAYNEMYIESYDIMRLKAGEESVLTTEHINPNIITDLKVKSYSYNLSNGDFINICRPTIYENPAIPREYGMVKVSKNMGINKTHKLSDKEDILEIVESKDSNKIDGKEYIETKVINKSSNNIKHVGLVYEVYKDGILAGSTVEFCIDEEIKHNKSSRIEAEVKKGVDLKFVGYTYKLDNKNKDDRETYIEVYKDDSIYTKTTI